ncbi:hypothetical protein F511_35546 [Dorcoceras hygrometricum]|uniref:Uncharacterized protein n=1 Tax=Dorcoceras hygrometricum TaxID=472368 RepID=A0A2Z7CG46_9LAMI|nr:hypothetical protein F511_35546 [Dorcoceras hygrometricum]
MQMQFVLGDTLVTWQGSSSHRNMSTTITTDAPPPELRQLLESYGSLFDEPQDLPPSRGFSHKILLEQERIPLLCDLIVIPICKRMKLKSNVRRC